MVKGKPLWHRDFREIFYSEIVSLTGGVAAGAMLAAATDQIMLVPGLLILLPGFLEMRGGIAGSMSARLSSALFLKVMKPRVKGNRVLRENIIASVVLAFIVSVVLGLVAFAFSYYFFGISSPKIIYVAIIAGLLSNFIIIPLTVVANFWLFRHGHDPNNIMGPYVTTMGDIVSVFSILAAIALMQ